MSKLSKADVKSHREACDLLRKDVLTDDERWFVLNNWQESAEHINSAAGAFFTPEGLACDFAIEVPGGRIVDLCAGIGMLGFAALQNDKHNGDIKSVTCVEINPAYVAVGRKILPEAEWICGDVFSVELSMFDSAISNPPFGNIKRSHAPERFRKGRFDLAIVELASEIAEYGAFILPTMSLPWVNGMALGAAGLLRPSCIDASYHAEDWRGVSPKVSVAVADFRYRDKAQLSLFQMERAS